MSFFEVDRIGEYVVAKDIHTDAWLVQVGEYMIYATPDWDGEPDVLDIEVVLDEDVLKTAQVPVRWTGRPPTDIEIWTALVRPYVRKAEEKAVSW